jgi:hypothetical protein
MKKVLLIAMLLFVGMCSCSSRALVISDSYFKANVKKIVVLPVFITEAVIPPLPEQLKEMDYDKNERTLFLKKLTASSPFFQKASELIMSKGKFALETVIIGEKEGNEIFKQVLYRNEPLKINRELSWPLNLVYSLDAKMISALASKYNADAVLFHYFQANKRLQRYSWSGYKVTYYVTLPHWYLEYSSVIYGKNGKVLFDNTVSYLQMEEKQSLENGMHRSVKIPVMAMQWHLFDENEVKKELLGRQGCFYRDFLKM